MRIDKLYLSDFRGVHNLELDFKGKSAILFGINGAGKSTILTAVNLLYAPILNRVVKQRFKQNVTLETRDIQHGKASAKICCDFVFEEGQIYSFCRKIMYDNKRWMDLEQLDRLADFYEAFYIGETKADEDNNLVQKNPQFSLPIFVNYGVNRLVLKTPLRIRKGQDYGQYSTFEKAIENQIAFDKLFEWFLEQELDETLKQKQDSRYRDKALMSVKKAMLAMLDDCQDIHIVAKPYSMKVTKNGEILDVLQLSDGEKCTLALFGDIARRLAMANPSLDNPLDGDGVVLIDELELHMHASWQRKVVRVLRQTFPNVQFIMTTHSPQILGEIDESFQLFSLTRGEQDVGMTCIRSLYGMDSNAILEDVLMTDSVNVHIKTMVEQMYEAVERREFDRAENIADKIDEQTLGRNADTVRARIMIRRGKIRNA